MTIRDLQQQIRATYGDRDRVRGLEGTFRWFVEEVGELARALRTGDAAALAIEAGDVVAWLASVADLAGVDLETAAARYARGCPKCDASPCRCSAGG